MPYQYVFSPDLAFKIIASGSGLVLYSKGDSIDLGPDVAGSKAHLWKVNKENEGVYNVESGLYIQGDGKLAASPQVWDLNDIGGSKYNIKVRGLAGAANLVHGGQGFEIVPAA